MSKEKPFIEIGKRLRSVRGETDQRNFSRFVDVSQQAISNYERGNLPGSWVFLRRLNEDLNVNLNWLFSGQGFKDHRAGTPYASLADNRPPEWPRAFLEQIAFQETAPLERILGLYFLYLFTEPADAKTRFMADFQAIVDQVRRGLGTPHAAGEKLVAAVLDALATDDRAGAVAALTAWGAHLEREGESGSPGAALPAYLAAVNLARMQGLRDQEVEAAGRAGRLCASQGRWSETERLFDEVVARFADPEAGAALPAAGDGGSATSPAAAALALSRFGDVARNKGDLSCARERYVAAMRWASLAEDTRLLAGIGHDLALLDALARSESGDASSAAAALRVLAREAEAESDAALAATISTHLAGILLDLGSPDEAEGVLRGSAAAAAAQGDAANLARRKILAARLGAARGQKAAARAGFLGAMRFARDRGLADEFDRAAAAFAKALESADHPESKAR